MPAERTTPHRTPSEPLVRDVPRSVGVRATPYDRPIIPSTTWPIHSHGAGPVPEPGRWPVPPFHDHPMSPTQRGDRTSQWQYQQAAQARHAEQMDVDQKVPRDAPDRGLSSLPPVAPMVQESPGGQSAQRFWKPSPKPPVESKVGMGRPLGQPIGLTVGDPVRHSKAQHGPATRVMSTPRQATIVTPQTPMGAPSNQTTISESTSVVTETTIDPTTNMSRTVSYAIDKLTETTPDGRTRVIREKRYATAPDVYTPGRPGTTVPATPENAAAMRAAHAIDPMTIEARTTPWESRYPEARPGTVHSRPLGGGAAKVLTMDVDSDDDMAKDGNAADDEQEEDEDENKEEGSTGGKEQDRPATPEMPDDFGQILSAPTPPYLPFNSRAPAPIARSDPSPAASADVVLDAPTPGQYAPPICLPDPAHGIGPTAVPRSVATPQSPSSPFPSDLPGLTPDVGPVTPPPRGRRYARGQMRTVPRPSDPPRQLALFFGGAPPDTWREQSLDRLRRVLQDATTDAYYLQPNIATFIFIYLETVSKFPRFRNDDESEVCHTVLRGLLRTFWHHSVNQFNAGLPVPAQAMHIMRTVVTYALKMFGLNHPFPLMATEAMLDLRRQLSRGATRGVV